MCYKATQNRPLAHLSVNLRPRLEFSVYLLVFVLFDHFDLLFICCKFNDLKMLLLCYALNPIEYEPPPMGPKF